TAFDDLAVGESRTTSVGYTNLDNNGGTSSSTLTITVTGTNDAPVAVADTGTTAENVTLTVAAASGVLFNDTDPDTSDTHTVSAVDGVALNVGAAVTGTAGGSFTIAADGSYSFNPGTAFDDLAVGESRTTSVGYTNLDNNGGTSSSTLTITVTGTNDAPTLVGDLAATVLEAGSYTISLADLGYTDVDDSDAGVTFIVGGFSNGKIQVNGVDALNFTGTDLTAGRVTFVHDGSETTTASFKVSVEDGNEDVSNPVESTFTLDVTPTSDSAPGAVPDAITVAEGGTATALVSAATSVKANDTGLLDTPVNVSLVTDVSHGTLTLNPDGSFSYKHDGLENFSDHFVYRLTDTDGQTSDAMVTITIAPGAGLDLDGIPLHVEETLATMSASTGNGGNNGDLNADGKQDGTQNALATLAWIKTANFEAALNGTLTQVESIISLEVASVVRADGSTDAGDTQYQLSNIKVIAQDSAAVGGMLVNNTIDKNGRTIQAPWDPIQFTVTPVATDADGHLDDLDAARAGTQIVVAIDISRAGINEGGFNAYLKYVTAAAIQSASESGVALNDLDGNAITQAGWYDFTQRKDASGKLVGDGAVFIVRSGKIVGIQLTLTDNAFGDGDMTVDRVSDPGMPVLRVVPVPVSLVIRAHPSVSSTDLDGWQVSVPLSDDMDAGIRFQYPPFDSTLFALESLADPKNALYIEPASWSWMPPEQDLDGDGLNDSPFGQDQWQALVLPSGHAGLHVFRGMGDQFAQAATLSRFAVPTDAFVHTQLDAEVFLTARLADGSELPDWVKFDAKSGVFALSPPDSFRGELKIKLWARDAQGREASTLFRLQVGDKRTGLIGRSGLSDQIRVVSQGLPGHRGYAESAPDLAWALRTEVLHPAPAAPTVASRE
ncbi:MAG: VCBS domain-containing protein, partial [Rhodoferax sp.]|nr:VCBS domain-containing protein [Rhodoferax sp.]